MNIIHAFGVPSSPLQVSAMLTNLRVGHTLVSGIIRSINSDKHLSKRQPAWPVVLPSINAIPRFKCSMPNQVLLVCDALAMLSTCNMRLIKPDNMAENIPLALQYATRNPLVEWSLIRKEPSISDYVNNATKPSFLNFIQTELYKLTPYDLRKDVQAMVIRYLDGAIKLKPLKDKLQSSHKLTNLLGLIMDSQTLKLREAIAEYKKTGNLEVTAVQYGIETFEILYVVRSASNNKEK